MSERECSAFAVPASRGGRSPGRSAPATGRREPPPSTSTPTSPTPSRATCGSAGDDDFAAEVGLELLVETARLWCSVGHLDSGGSFRIDGVTGPDEYSAVADNNVYTNLMAQRNLVAAAGASERHSRTRPPARRRRGGDQRVARDRRRDAHPLRRVAADPPAGRRIHRARGVGLRGDEARPVSAAAALPLLRPVPQAGRQAGRPRAGDVPLRGRLRRRPEGAQLRLLRAAHRTRLIAVGLHPGRSWRSSSATSTWHVRTCARPP